MKCSLNAITNQREANLKILLHAPKSLSLGSLTWLITRATFSSSYGEMLTLPHYETIDGKFGKYENAVFPRMKNLRTKKTNNGRNFDWPTQQLSINQKRERQTFRKRFVSRCFFVSPWPWPRETSGHGETKKQRDTNRNVIYKGKRKLSLISG